MIEKPAFMAGMKILAMVTLEPQGRSLTEPMASAYYAILAEHFTPETWEATVRRTAEREKFFPAPAALLGHAKAIHDAVAFAGFFDVPSRPTLLKGGGDD